MQRPVYILGVQRIRVVIAEDHDAIRDGIRRLLSSQADIEVIGEACDGKEAYEVVADVRPDAVVMDLQMPEEDGETASRRIVADFPRMSSVVVSASDPLHALHIAEAIGAAAFIPKHECAARLAGTIRRAVAERADT